MDFLSQQRLPAPARLVLRLGTSREQSKLSRKHHFLSHPHPHPHPPPNLSNHEKDAHLNADESLPPAEEQTAAVRGVVWSADKQTGLVLALVPQLENGGAAGPLPWMPGMAGGSWAFERGQDAAYCRAMAFKADDIVGQPTMIEMDGDPLVEWWHVVLHEAKVVREEKKRTENKGGNERLEAVVDKLKKARVPAERRDGTNGEVELSVLNGVVVVVEPFDRKECIRCEDEELRDQLALALFDEHNASTTTPTDGTESEGEEEVGNDLATSTEGKKNNKKKKQNNPLLGVLRHKNTTEIGEARVFYTQVQLAKYSAYMTRRVTPKHVGPPPPEYAHVPHKYFTQRYRLFSKFDHGVLLDEESWYSVTPETIAEHISERCRSGVVLDLFGGCGGNAIQFAFTCERVIYVEMNPDRVELARNNARVYGVEDRIEFIQADAINFLKMLSQKCRKPPIDTIFLSPPWGGPEYQNADSFDLRSIQIPTTSQETGWVDGLELYKLSMSVCAELAIFVPRNTDPLKCQQQCSSVNNSHVTLEFEQHVVDDRVKTCCLYFGDLLAKKTLQIQ